MADSVPRRFEGQACKSIAKADGLEIGYSDEAQEEQFKSLTRDEAQAVRESNPSFSLWAVLAGQAATGAFTALLAWALTGQARMGWSAGYGALAVVVPAALFARGLSRQKSAAHGNAALVGFFVWEIIKIVVTVAMLFAVPRLMADVSWPALLVGFVVTMKVYWGAMWFRPARKKSFNNF